MQRTTTRRPLAVAFVLSALAAGAARADESPSRLAALPIDAGTVTVSGVSSGGAMAVQFHTAYSQRVQGVGALASPPYYCAEGQMAHALGRCMKDGSAIPVAQLHDRLRTLAGKGDIDPIDGLRGDRVWLYRGTADPVVHASVADALQRYYEPYVGKDALQRVERDGAGHNFPIAADGASKCEASEPPYIASCGYDAARALLAHLYGSLASGPAVPDEGELRAFDQRPYALAAGSAGLDDRGWLYVPASCARSKPAEGCRLHVVFHGCRQGASFVGEDFIRRSGYLDVARANRIVVLFPQVKPTTAPLNPLGCWDWWGYEDEHYATQRGRQIQAVRAMIDDLLSVPAR